MTTTFTGYSPSYETQILVNSGGHFTATNSSFTYVKVYLDNGSVVGASDFIGNSFTTSIFLPQSDVQYLSNNAQFADVNILAGNVPNGQTLNLNGMDQLGNELCVPRKLHCIDRWTDDRRGRRDGRHPGGRDPDG